MTVRVRFPPSPTGRKHLGNYRTMLFNWLFARSQGGAVVLRYEDTDRERSDRRWEGGIESTLRVLGLDWDEGPYRQSDRSDHYRSAADGLLSSGRAYRCWCTEADLQAMRDVSVAEGRPPHFEHDRWCRFREARPDPAAVRFASPLEGTTSFVDAVIGDVSVDNASIGDRVLVRADGTPVYQLTVVVDDLDMEITHIIRGVDLLASTPLQINLALALGRTNLPVFAHVPLIVGADGRKLSTRHGPVALEDYLELGVLPEALINYMGLLGWSFPDGREVFTLGELQAAFDLDRIGASAAMFDSRKLEHLNGEWLRRLPVHEVARRGLAFFPPDERPHLVDQRYLSAVSLAAERIRYLSELPALTGFLFRRPEPDPRAWEAEMTKPTASAFLEASAEAIEMATPFEAQTIGAAHRATAEHLAVKVRDLQRPARVALTGTEHGLPLWDSMALLGRAECLARIDAARERLTG